MSSKNRHTDTGLARVRRVRLYALYSFLAMLLLLVLALVVGRVALEQSAPNDLISFSELKKKHQSSYIELLDRRGQVLDKVRQDFNQRQGEWLSLDDISPVFIDGRGGASGISMQLASMLEPKLQANKSRNYSQKWLQMASALALE